jgi:plastocyanin domain-containing protein
MRNKIIIIAALASICAFSSFEVSAQQNAGTKQRATQKTQNIRINLTEKGYQPESFRLRKGVRARITFIRKTEDECGKEVVFPAFNIRRTLPLNEPVTIIFTPRKAGTFSFVCGMDMLHGKLIVQ